MTSPTTPKEGMRGSPASKLQAHLHHGIRMAAVALMVVATAACLGGGEAARPPGGAQLRVGISAEMLQHIPPPDAKAALEVLGQKLGRAIEVFENVTASVLHDETEVRQAFRTHGLDVVFLPVQQFMTLRDTIPELEPCFVPVCGGRVTNEYSIMVRKDSRFSRLNELKKANLIVQGPPGTNSIARVWLDVLTGRAGLGTAASFFRLNSVPPPSKGVFSVFFRQAEACGVWQPHFEAMAGQNPQLEEQLIRLATSPPLVRWVVCIRTDYAPEHRKDVVEAVATLHATPEGKQLLHLLQQEGVAPFREEYLEPVRTLMRQQQELKALSRGPASFD